MSIIVECLIGLGLFAYGFLNGFLFGFRKGEAHAEKKRKRNRVYWKTLIELDKTPISNN